MHLIGIGLRGRSIGSHKGGSPPAGATEVQGLGRPGLQAMRLIVHFLLCLLAPYWKDMDPTEKRV